VVYEVLVLLMHGMEKLLSFFGFFVREYGLDYSIFYSLFPRGK
jgi:hypothetical protein